VNVHINPGKVFLEVVDPVSPVGPPSLSRSGAIDVEGIRDTRIAEGYHLFGEPRRNLADAFHRTFGRERLDRRRLVREGLTGCGEKQREDQKEEENRSLHRIRPIRHFLRPP
jgi:hypothetical protein